MTPISVIIPLAKGDEAWRELLIDLQLPRGSEVILAAGDQELQFDADKFDFDVRVTFEGSGRAEQMNYGVKSASFEWLWFLHADTKLAEDTLAMMKQIVERQPSGFFFFDLKFSKDGPSAMRWNEWAVRWRAGKLRLPFGDQAFLIHRNTFMELGGYREDLRYGEDHLLVWKAHQLAIPVSRAGAAVYTSARRYEDNGWISTTSWYVWLTIVQALPQWMILQKLRLKRLFA